MSESFMTPDGFEVSSTTETSAEMAETHAPEPQEGTEEGGEGQEAASDGEEPTGEPKKPEGPQKPKLGRPKKDPNARVLDAVRKEKDAREALAAERAEKERIAARLRELESAKTGKEEPKEAKPAQNADGRPKSDDFASWEEYEDALLEWKFQKAEAERTQKSRAEAVQSKKISEIQNFNKRIAAATEADPDFPNKVSPDVIQLMPSMLMTSGKDVGPLNALADRFIVSEKGPALMMYFSDHPEEVQRLSQLYNPQEFWMELGYIERGLVSAPSLPQVQNPSISKAKPPVRPVAGSSIGSDDGNLDDMPIEEYIKRENARERQARRR